MFSIPVMRALSAYNIAYAALPATSAYISFTPTADTAKQKQFTLHIPLGLIKPGAQTVFAAGDGASTNFVTVQITATNQLDFVLMSGGAYVGRRTTTRTLQDYSGFYFVTLVMDTPNATALDRMRVYIDLTRETDFATTTNPAQNLATSVFKANQHNFLKLDYAAYYGNVYLGGNTCLIGQALEPTNFLDLDLGTGNVKAKDLTPLSPEYLFMFENSGAMGTNSGSAGNATVTGTLNQVTSTPTNEFTRINPLAISYNSVPTVSNGNRTITGTAGLYQNAALTFNHMGKKGYFEFDFTGTIDAFIAFDDAANVIDTNSYAEATCHRTRVDGSLAYGATTLVSGYLAVMTTGVRYGCAFDFTGNNRNVWFRNETTWGTRGSVGDPEAGAFAGFTATELTASNYNILFMVWSGCGMNLYFEDVDFTHTPPTGFPSLCTNNLPVQTGNIDDHFKTVLYTGNGVAIGSGGNPITGVGFQPDFAWLKSRSSVDYHAIVDLARGVTKRLYTNTTDAEVTGTETVGSFDSDGFTLGSNTTWNNNTTSYVAWCASLPNTKTSGWAGSPTITPTKEIYNAKLGMSIVTYTGDGVAGSIPHSQGKAPGMVIVKRLDTAGYSWMVYHSALGVGYYGMLDSAAAFTAAGASGVWNSLDPTASLVNIGTSAQVNASGGTYVAYIFAETEFCKIGSYIGNGSTDGPFINTGTSVVWNLMKRADAVADWSLLDSARPGYNLAYNLFPDTSGAENTTTWANDLTSTGFKLRQSYASQNASGGTFAYVTFGQPNGPTENTAR